MIKSKILALDLANYVIFRSNELNAPLNQLKLRILMYFIIIRYLKKYNHLIVEEPIVKWQYGPVIESVYHQFKIYHYNLVPISYIKNRVNFDIEFQPIETSIENCDCPKLRSIVDEVILQYQCMSGLDLVKLVWSDWQWKKDEDKILSSVYPVYTIEELKLTQNA